MRSVPFFTDDIAIRPDEASERGHLSRPVTIREFARGGPVRLLDCGEGRLRLEADVTGRPGFRFIEGPEII